MFYYKIFDLLVNLPFPLNEIADYEKAGNADIVVTLQEKITTPPMTLVENLTRFGVNPYFGGDLNDAYMDWEQFGCFHCKDGNTIFFDKKASESPLLNHLIITEPITFVLFQRGYFLLHASAIVLPNGEVCIFFGEPGAGKSTTMAAFLKAGCTYLSDDLVAITFDEKNQPWVVPSFLNVKLWKSAIDALNFDMTNALPIATKSSKYGLVLTDKFHKKSAPLKYLFSIENDDSKAFTITKVEGINAHLNPLKHFPLPSSLLDNSEAIKKRFTDGINISKATISYEITRNSTNFKEIRHFVKEFIAASN